MKSIDGSRIPGQTSKTGSIRASHEPSSLSDQSPSPFQRQAAPNCANDCTYSLHSIASARRRHPVRSLETLRHTVLHTSAHRSPSIVSSRATSIVSLAGLTTSKTRAYVYDIILIRNNWFLVSPVFPRRVPL